MPFRLQVFKKEKMWDVVRAQYILDCIRLQDIIPLEPKYMFIVLDSTRKEFLKHMDEYGDHYTKFVDEDNMKEVSKQNVFILFFGLALINKHKLLEKMGKDENAPDRRKSTQDIVDAYFPAPTDGMPFIHTVAYFDYDVERVPPVPLTMEWVKWKRIQEESKLAQDQFEFELGQVTKSTLNQDVTHVIMNSKDLSRFKTLKEAFHKRVLPRFVTVDWIGACIRNNTLVNELGKEKIKIKIGL